MAGKRLVVGRGPECDIFVPSPLMGRRHCMLLLDEFTLRIRDLGSRSGTFVNGRPIRTGEIVLLHGDLITVAGGTTFVVTIDPVFVPSVKTDDTGANKMVDEGDPNTD